MRAKQTQFRVAELGGVAGVELATASEPPARQPRIWGRRPSGVGRRPQPPLSCELRLNHARLNERSFDLLPESHSKGGRLTTTARLSIFGYADEEADCRTSGRFN